MRLLFVARRYWPAVGGIETLLRHVARELGERHELTVLAHRIDDGPHGRLSDSLDPPRTFEAFDENWKGGPSPEETEKHWGLFRADRTPKLVVEHLFGDLVSAAP